MEQVREQLVPATLAGTNAEVKVGGEAAESKDFSDSLAERPPLVFAFVLGLAFQEGLGESLLGFESNGGRSASPQRWDLWPDSSHKSHRCTCLGPVPPGGPGGTSVRLARIAVSGCL